MKRKYSPFLKRKVKEFFPSFSDSLSVTLLFMALFFHTDFLFASTEISSHSNDLCYNFINKLCVILKSHFDMLKTGPSCEPWVIFISGWE